MYTELVDALRCTASHEETWLVAAAERTEGRHIISGRLGCPICRMEYPIVGGAADFRTEPAVDAVSAGRETPRRVGEEELLRTRALLNLVDEGGTIALVGGAGDLLEALEQSTSATYLLINPLRANNRLDVSTVWFDHGEPLARGSIRAALVQSPVTGDVLRGVVRSLRVAARLVAPVSINVPTGVQELARDERQWVAERLPDLSVPVELRRRQSAP